MRAVILLLICPVAVIAYGHSYRPIVPPDDLPKLCDQMEYAAKWLADHPDDMEPWIFGHKHYSVDFELQGVRDHAPSRA